MAGFAFVPTSGSTAGTDNDRLLLDRDRVLASPPERRIPDEHDSQIRRTAVAPADRLPPSRIHHAPAALISSVTDLLRGPQRPWSAFAADLLNDIQQAGHFIWLSGGAVRDLVIGAEPNEVHDLDMAGTMPPGQFSEISYRRLKLAGMGDCRRRVSPRLICSIATPPQYPRIPLIEYKALTQDGFQFPASGANLDIDAASRDFTINALFYDHNQEQLLDPHGQGLSHLKSIPRELVPVETSPNPAKAAELVLRAIKFMHRWRVQKVAVKADAVADWLDYCPIAQWQTIDPARRHRLWDLASKCLHTIEDSEVRRLATELGPAAQTLLEHLLRRDGFIDDGRQITQEHAAPSAESDRQSSGGQR